MRSFAAPLFQEGRSCAQAALHAQRRPASTAFTRRLELEQGVQGIHLHPIDVLDLVLLELGADADLPDVEADADAVERVGPGGARGGPRRARVEAPRQDTDLAVEVE